MIGKTEILEDKQASPVDSQSNNVGDEDDDDSLPDAFQSQEKKAKMSATKEDQGVENTQMDTMPSHLMMMRPHQKASNQEPSLSRTLTCNSPFHRIVYNS